MVDLDLGAIERHYGPQSSEDARLVCVLVDEVKRLREAYQVVCDYAGTVDVLIARLAEITAERDHVLEASECNGIAKIEQFKRAEAAEAKLAVAEQERDDSHKLISKQAALLTASVNVLRGQPPDLVWWSHHDIAEHAQHVVTERDVAKDRLAAIEQACAQVDDVREYGSRRSTFYAGADQLRRRIRIALDREVSDSDESQ